MSAGNTISIEMPKHVVERIIGEHLDRFLASPAMLQPMVAARIGEACRGGIYAGLTIHENAPHELILLPGEKESINWKDALDWAAQQGAALPSRFDALTLFENLKSEFKPEWYWTSAQHASAPSYAWMQGFNDGGQTCLRTGYDFRARAVRRFPLSYSVIDSFQSFPGRHAMQLTKKDIIPQLNAGEQYAGIVIAGESLHHLVLLPGDTDKNWTDAIAWAKELGGELPTRQEQAILYGNLKGEFKPDYYWSSAQHASDPSFAWLQNFLNGSQGFTRTDTVYRARAVLGEKP